MCLIVCAFDQPRLNRSVKQRRGMWPNGEKRAWKKGHLEYGKKPSFSINRFCSNDCKIYICWNLRGMVLWSGTYDTVMCNGAYGSVGFWCLLCPIVTVTDMFTFYFLLNFINFWKVLRKQVSFLGGELLCILYIIKRICIHIFIYIICTSNHILYVYLYIYIYMYIYMYILHTFVQISLESSDICREAAPRRWANAAGRTCCQWSLCSCCEVGHLAAIFHRRIASKNWCLKPWSLKSQKSWVQPRMIALRRVLMQS